MAHSVWTVVCLKEEKAVYETKRVCKIWALKQFFCGISLKYSQVEKGETFPANKQKWEICLGSAIEPFGWQCKKGVVRAVRPEREDG